MASIDERVVAMSFENAKFEAGVAQTMGTLSKLNEALKNVGKDSGLTKLEAESHKVTMAAPMSAIDKLKAKLSGISVGGAFSSMEAASHKVSFSGIIGAIDKVKSRLHFGEAKAAFAELEGADDKVTFADANAAIERTAGHFSVITGAAAVAFGNIATQAATGAANAVKSVLGAIKDGFSDYELKIGATQTIMAGTGEDIKTVTNYLKDLDEYADRTIYNLRDMTGNIGKFTNAGVDLETAVQAMKGIANLAALSGANADEAAHAMYNLGQSIGQGTVRLGDWKSVDIANMGTKEFKEQLIDAALAMGTLKKGNDGTIRSLKGNVVNYKTFNSTLQDQWLTAEALTKTLNKYSDESTNLGKRAYAAASDVKTFSMMLTTLAAAAGTGWTDTFDIIFGNLPEATKMWTDMTNAIGGIIGKSTEMRNKVLQDWKDLGGRTELINGVKAAFNALKSILAPIGEAFRDIFPRKTGEQLLEMTKQFKEFMQSLTLAPATAENVRRIFAGLFAVLEIGWTVIKGVVGIFGDLIGVLSGGAGGLLDFAGGIGDFLVAINDVVSEGKGLQGIFDAIAASLGPLAALLKDIASYLVGLFTDDNTQNSKALGDSFDALAQKITPLAKIADWARSEWQQFMEQMEAVKRFFQPLADYLGTVFIAIRDKVAEGLEALTSDKGLETLQTGLLAGILYQLKKVVSGFKIGVGVEAIGELGDTLKSLTGSLVALQSSVRAATLATIAVAIGLLAGSVAILAAVDAEKMKSALTAIAVGVGQLIAALYLLGKLNSGGAIAALPVLAASMVIMAVAVNILALALLGLSRLSWEELAKGLTGMAGALLAVGLAVKMIGPQITYVGPALIPLAFGMNLLAAAMTVMAHLSWEELVKGLIGLGGALATIGLAITLIGPKITVIAPALLAVGLALTFISSAMRSMGGMKWEEIAKGMVAIGGALAAIGLAIGLMPPTMLAQAAGLIVVAIALQGIAAAVGIFGSYKIETIAKGLAALGGSLLILAGGLTLMNGAGGGSLALMGAAMALSVLVPALGLLGIMPWKVIFKGLAGIVLILGVLAVAGLVAAAPLAAIGAALQVLGFAMLTIAGAILLFSASLKILSQVGTKGLVVLGASVVAFIALIPKLVKDFLIGFVEVLEQVALLAPKIAVSLGVVIDQLLVTIANAAPKLAEAVGMMIDAMLFVLVTRAPDIAAAGFKILLTLMTAIRDNLPKVMDTGTDIVVKFLEGLARNAPRIIQAGVNTLVKFLSGINTHLGKVVEGVAKIVTTFLKSVTSHIPQIVKSGVTLIITFLKQILLSVPRFVKAGVTIVVAFLDGIGDAIPRLVRAGLNLARRFLNGIADGLSGLADVGFKAIIRFLNGLERAIRENFDDLFEAGAGVADAIIDGLVDQFGKLSGLLHRVLDAVFSKLPGWAKKILGIHSPSRVFAEIGKNVMLGFIQGVEDSGPAIKKSMERGANSVVDTATKAFGDVPSLLDGIIDTEPVITPVLDLSVVEKDAKKIGDIADVVPISAAASFDQASAIKVPTPEEAAQAAQAGTSFEFNQYNTSPEKLSEIEIYRQTKNQLGQVKSVLGLAK